ncbi:MAG: twin-arginine translocase TatA/TatE family subunit [Planctomycetota bacterium]
MGKRRSRGYPPLPLSRNPGRSGANVHESHTARVPGPRWPLGDHHRPGRGPAAVRRRIPGIARSLGQGIVEFRKGLKSGEEDKKKELENGSSGASEHKD